MNKGTKTEMIAFRTTKELKKKLEAMAVKNSRTLSDYLHLALEKLASKEN